MKRISAEDLVNSGKYELMDTLEYENLIPFLNIYSKAKTSLTYIFLVLSISVPAIMTFLIFINIENEEFEIYLSIGHVLMAFSILIVLIPIHEYIHSLAYKVLGAKETSFYANWKKFYFGAVADRFVISKNEFKIVAFAPFVIITAILISGLPFVDIYWKLTILCCLFIHIMTCSGDFSMFNYFIVHQKYEIFTFDDKASKITFFYRKKSNLNQIH